MPDKKLKNEKKQTNAKNIKKKESIFLSLLTDVRNESRKNISERIILGRYSSMNSSSLALKNGIGCY